MAYLILQTWTDNASFPNDDCLGVLEISKDVVNRWLEAVQVFKTIDSAYLTMQLREMKFDGDAHPCPFLLSKMPDPEDNNVDLLPDIAGVLYEKPSYMFLPGPFPQKDTVDWEYITRHFRVSSQGISFAWGYSDSEGYLHTHDISENQLREMLTELEAETQDENFGLLLGFLGLES